MTNMINNYMLVFSINLINNTIITYTNTIAGFSTFKFTMLNGERVVRESFNCLNNPWNILSANNF